MICYGQILFRENALQILVSFFDAKNQNWQFRCFPPNGIQYHIECIQSRKKLPISEFKRRNPCQKIQHQKSNIENRHRNRNQYKHRHRHSNSNVAINIDVDIDDVGGYLRKIQLNLAVFIGR